MLLAEISTKRPVLATVLNLIIILTGIVSFFKLDIRRTPNVDPPIINIESTFAGGSPSYIEKNITNVIESYIKNVKHIDHFKSSSKIGFSEISITFKLEADIEQALSDVRSKVAESTSMLPDDMNSPIISKMDSDNFASMWITVTGKNYDPMVLTDIIKKRVNPEFEKLPTVSSSILFSSNFYAIQVKLDPLKLHEYKISPLEVKNAISNQTRDYPVGSIKAKSRNFTLMLEGSKYSAEDFAKIIIKTSNGQIVKLSDIAEVIKEPKAANEIIRFNGTDTVAIGLIKASDANVLDLSREAYKIKAELEKIIPSGIQLNIAYDASIPVEASIKSVFLTSFEALILVLLIVYLFLGNYRATIIPLTVIPVSLIGCFSFLYILGFTINLYSLLAMIMAIGLVVDDAIVMLENIYSHIEKGLKPFDASIKASKEIGFAIVSMTLTLVAVFFPIGFLEGFIGKLFIEFAWTLAFCVLISGFAALTISPSYSALILRKIDDKSKPKFIQKFDNKLRKLTDLYENKLLYIFNNQKIIGFIAIGTVALLAASFYFVKQEFVPQEDESFIFINGSTPDGANVEYTLNAVKDIEEIISATPEVKGYFFNASGNNLFGFIPLKEWQYRNKSQQSIVETFNSLLIRIPEATAFAINPGTMFGSFDKPISFKLTSFDEYSYLIDSSQKFVEALKKSDVFSAPERDLRTSMPTLDVKINNDLAAKYGVMIDQIGPTLQYLLSESVVAYFDVGNEKYNVHMGFAKNDKNEITDLSKIYVKSVNGDMLPLSSISTIIQKYTIESISHHNAAKSVKIHAELNKDKYSLQNAKDEILKIYNEVVDTNKISLVFKGDIEDMEKSNKGIYFTFILALFFIYLILSAQFESFIDPLIIILSVPFSILGAVLTLIIFDSSINLYSNIGLVTLIGLITKNSIMIVEFANQLKNQGIKVQEAIIRASKMRLRPILMTSCATILGSVPLVIATGASAASRSSIGLVIFGGMLIGTLFTIFVIPFIYYKVKK